MKNIAIILARCGSKGVKDKNIKPICGKPLMAYSIETAIESSMFDCIHVSTDSIKYAEIAQKYGADVPFLRSADNSSDAAGTWDAVREVIGKYEEIGKVFDTITVLQPTSPLRKSEDIKNAFRIFEEKRAKCVISVCEVEHHPFWSNALDDNGSMNGFIEEKNMIGRQQLPKYYRLNGAIYIISTDYIKQKKYLYDDKCFPYIMSQEKSIDIDTKLDFMIAELLLTYASVS